LEPTKEFLELQKHLASDKELRRFSLELYPDLDKGRPQASDTDRRVAERHTVSQMLQIMENTWVILDLDQNYKHPLYGGWMSLFRAWAKTKVFRENWKVLRQEYNERFVRFYTEKVDRR
jgi:hypothetical protein